MFRFLAALCVHLGNVATMRGRVARSVDVAKQKEPCSQPPTTPSVPTPFREGAAQCVAVSERKKSRVQTFTS